MLFGRGMVLLVLRHWGKSTRGEILECTEHEDEGGIVYRVTYEFSVPVGAERAAKRIAKQVTRRSYRPKDIIAVRYWPAWPRVSRFVERVA